MRRRYGKKRFARGRVRRRGRAGTRYYSRRSRRSGMRAPRPGRIGYRL